MFTANKKMFCHSIRKAPFQRNGVDVLVAHVSTSYKYNGEWVKDFDGFVNFPNLSGCIIWEDTEDDAFMTLKTNEEMIDECKKMFISFDSVSVSQVTKNDKIYINYWADNPHFSRKGN